jgi:hypothetical protein
MFGQGETDMPESVRVDSEHNIILIDSSHQVSTDELRQSLESVLQIAQQKTINKVMVDATRQKSLPSVMALYYFAVELSTRARGMRHAIVVAGESPEDLRFIENAARNRGVNMQIFSSQEDALSWLNLTSPAEPNR